MMYRGITFRIYIPLITIALMGYGMFWFYKDQTKPHFPSTFSLVQDIDIDTYLADQNKYLDGSQLLAVQFVVPQSIGRPCPVMERQGILYINPRARATVVISHGFMCDKFDMNFIRKALFADYNVLAFDFRAHGSGVDDIQTCTFGKDEAFDVIGAVRYVKSRYDIGHLPVIGYGFSMGAVASIQAQARTGNLFSALILDCPYDCTHNVVKRSVDKLQFNLFGHTVALPGRGLLCRFAFNPYVQSVLKRLLKMVAQLDALTVNVRIHPLSPANSMKKITIPCFFIHCMHDEKIDTQAAKQLYENANGYKRLWITNGRRHFDSIFYNPEKYAHKIRTFMDDVLSEKCKEKAPEKVHRDKPIKNV